jgi:hypothetical protein
MNWFENKKWIWIWNSNHTSLIIQTKQVQNFIQASTIHSETSYNTVAATVTPGVSQPSPLTKISTRDFEGVAARQEQWTITHFLTMEKWCLDGENKGSPRFPKLFLPQCDFSIVSWRTSLFYAMWHNPSDLELWLGAQGTTSQPWAVSLQATQCPPVPSNISFVVTCGRCHEH